VVGMGAVSQANGCDNRITSRRRGGRVGSVAAGRPKLGVGVSGLAFIASLVRSLAWPTAVVVVVVVFRRPLTSVIGHGLRRIKVGSFEAEFEQVQAQVRLDLARSSEVSQTAIRVTSDTIAPDAPDLVRLAELSPRDAMLQAFTRIETQLRELLHGLIDETTLSRQEATALAVMAQRNGLISAESVNAVQGLTAMRNLAARRSTDEVSTDKAVDFIVLTDAALFAIRNSRRPPPHSQP
jgi:hypothetical protein